MNLPNGNDLRQYGHHLLDREISIKSHEDQKTKHRYAFVFEKVMILTKMSKLGESGMYSYLDAFNLSDYRIEKPGGRRTLGREHRYTLLLARKSQSTAFTLYMKTEAECDMWFRALQNAMYVLLIHSHKNLRISILIHTILQFKFSNLNFQLI